MESSTSMNNRNEFGTLLAEFKIQLLIAVTSIQSDWDLLNYHFDMQVFEKFHHDLLRLADAGGTFGAVDISDFARKLELACKEVINENISFEEDKEIKNKMGCWIKKLKETTDIWLGSDAKEDEEIKENRRMESDLVYMLINNKTFEDDIFKNLEKHSYTAQKFTQLEKLQKFCQTNNPIVILVDEDFSDKDITGVKLIEFIRKNVNSLVPVIYMSSSTKTETKLLVVREGAERYFSKPVRLDKLLQTIKTLNTPSDTLPYRVLIIDNDIPLLNCYETILIDAGVQVEAISKPLSGFESIEKFKPDVIVVDISMPYCSGEELVKMIRLDDRWSLIPIIFLSAEQDINNQLDAMALGADDFLVKPINAKKLVVKITTTAKRARNSVKLNQNLKNLIRENKYQLSTLDQHAIVSVADVSGRIIHVNDKLCEISGYSRQELMGKNHRILKSKHHDQVFFKILWETISSGKVWHGVLCNLTKDGDEYWVDSTIVPFIDEKGKPYKYVSIRTNITELRVNERRLKRSQDFANIGTWDWNINTGKMYWSDRIWSLFGYAKDKTKMSYDNFIYAVHFDDRQRVMDAITSCVEHDMEYDIEHRVVWPDGSVHWIHESGDVVRNKEGYPQQMLGVVRDITKIKESEKNIIAAREEAENANRAKSQFLSSMSHELRTPMNAIMGFSQLLKINKSEPLTDQQEKNVDEIMVAGKHLMSLINEVLNLSKIESGHIDLLCEAVLLKDVITESLHLIEPLAQKKGIRIDVKINNKKIEFNMLDDFTDSVVIDKTRLKQVLLNLMSNAVKYNNENGRVTISYSKKNNNRFRISIMDTGNGLSEEQQSRLFIVFDRLGIENSGIEGTGIGLVITKKIVELMGGDIGVESQVDKGSEFWIELPYIQTNPESEMSETTDDTCNEDRGMAEKIEQTKNMKTVLYVEDNPANLRLVEQILSCIPNLHMWSAPESLLGLELARENIPDIILLDINLPGMDGYEFFDKLRKDEITKSIPVIAISANAMPKDINKALQQGFDGYITKPVNVNDLLSTVERKLNEL